MHLFGAQTSDARDAAQAADHRPVQAEYIQLDSVAPADDPHMVCMAISGALARLALFVLPDRLWVSMGRLVAHYGKLVQGAPEADPRPNVEETAPAVRKIVIAGMTATGAMTAAVAMVAAAAMTAMPQELVLPVVPSELVDEPVAGAAAHPLVPAFVRALAIERKDYAMSISVLVRLRGCWHCAPHFAPWEVG